MTPAICKTTLLEPVIKDDQDRFKESMTARLGTETSVTVLETIISETTVCFKVTEIINTIVFSIKEKGKNIGAYSLKIQESTTER